MIIVKLTARCVCVCALSHLPIDDIEKGLEDVNKRFEFDDKQAKRQTD